MLKMFVYDHNTLAIDEDVANFDCGCKDGPKKTSCCFMFSKETIQMHRINCKGKDYCNSESYNYIVEHLIAQMDCLTKDSVSVYLHSR